VYFGIVNRMILAELVKVFLMSLVALTGMFLLAGLIQEATQKGLSPAQILTAIPLIIPNTLPFTIPATTLFATCVVYGRMSADNEVLVLRAAGVNIYHLLWPALILGALTAAATGALYYDTIPRSQQLLRKQLLKDGEEIIYGMIKREGGLRHSSLDFALFVRDVQGRNLIDVVVKKRRADKSPQADKPLYELVARAQVARLRIRKVAAEGARGPDPGDPPARPESVLDRFQKRQAGLRGAEQYELVVFMDRCFVDSLKGDAAADLQGKEFTTPLPESIFGKDPKMRPSSQTWTELFANRQEVAAELEALRQEAREYGARGTAPSPIPAVTYGELAIAHEEPIKHDAQLLRQIELEIQMRPALAVGCLCFVLIGCPVGVWASRSDYLSVFIICFLPTVFVYYPLLLASLNLAKNSKVPDWAAWGANIVAFLTALILIQRLMKR
jgi:lipopolysaccharide export system permease protein